MDNGKLLEYILEEFYTEILLLKEKVKQLEQKTKELQDNVYYTKQGIDREMIEEMIEE